MAVSFRMWRCEQYPKLCTPQLYGNFEDLYPVLEFPFFMQRKLFGERALFSKDHKFYIPSYPEFDTQQLKHLYIDIPSDWVLDGFLVLEAGRDPSQLSALIRFLINGVYPHAQIRYVIFDAFVQNRPDLSYEERLNLLANELIKVSVPGVTYTMSALANPYNFATTYGVLTSGQTHTVIIRDTEARYQPGTISLSGVEAKGFSFATASILRARHVLNDFKHLQLECLYEGQLHQIPYRITQMETLHQESWYANKQVALAVYRNPRLLLALYIL